MEKDVTLIRRYRVQLVKAGRAAGMSDTAINLAMGGGRIKSTRRKASAWKNDTPPTIEQIMEVFIAESAKNDWPVTMEEITSARMLAVWVGPRMAAMWAVKTILGSSVSFSQIGEAFGGKHHSTVQYACKEAAAGWFKEKPALHKAALATLRFFKK